MVVHLFPRPPVELPYCWNKYVQMDGGGKLGKSCDVHQTFTNFGYTIELTGPNSSNQNGPGDRHRQTIGDALWATLSAAILRPNFWPYAFHHYVCLYNFVTRYLTVKPVQDVWFWVTKSVQIKDFPDGNVDVDSCHARNLPHYSFSKIVVSICNCSISPLKFKHCTSNWMLGLLPL